MKISEIVTAAGAVLLVCAVFLGGLGIVAALCLLPSIIAWLLYNHAIAPAFHWPQANFLLVFTLLWFASLIGRFVFGRSGTRSA